jgi:hypothetical protein
MQTLRRNDLKTENASSGGCLRVLLSGDGERARAARRAFVAALLMAMATSSEAQAVDPWPAGGLWVNVRDDPGVSVASTPPSAHDIDGRGRRSGFSFDLRLGAGLAGVVYDEDDRDIADFEAFALGGAMRFGSFLDPHVVVGAELVLTWGFGSGELRVRDPDFFDRDGYPTHAAYGSFSPFGVFVEVYPWEREGLFFGAAGGVGFMELPRFGDASGGVMARYALELGYELGRTGKEGPAVYLRHERWRGSELPFSEDHPDGLVSRELLVGLRWSFWSPLWHPPRRP